VLPPQHALLLASFQIRTQSLSEQRGKPGKAEPQSNGSLEVFEVLKVNPESAFRKNGGLKNLRCPQEKVFEKKKNKRNRVLESLENMG